MSDPFVGEIRAVGFNFAPTGWALCNGQLLPISQNTALFSLLGTYYGGDGRSTFALPDLTGSALMHHGQGPGLTERFLGEVAGEPTVTLVTPEVPGHSHALMASPDDADSTSPVGAVPGFATSSVYRSDTDTTLATQAVQVVGQSQPHTNLQPFLAVSYIIALQGVFPPRS